MCRASGSFGLGSGGGADFAEVAPEDPEHPAKGLGGAPQELVPDRERGEVLAAHPELADPPDRDFEPAAHRGRGELGEARLRGCSRPPAPSRAHRR